MILVMDIVDRLWEKNKSKKISPKLKFLKNPLVQEIIDARLDHLEYFIRTTNSCSSMIKDLDDVLEETVELFLSNWIKSSDKRNFIKCGKFYLSLEDVGEAKPCWEFECGVIVNTSYLELK